MKSKRNWLMGWIILMTAIVCSGALAQNLDIGYTRGVQGRTVSVPVTLWASEDMTAALVRVEYDPLVLENPSVTGGALLSGDHALDSYSPEAGRFNVMVYSVSGVPALTAQAGYLCFLTFDIKPDASLGKSPIILTTSGIPDLPASNIADILGALVDHTTQAGNVTVLDKRALVDQSWLLYE